MNFSLKKILLLASLSIFPVAACTKPAVSDQNGNPAQTAKRLNTENNAAVKDDVEELGKIIKLPAAPEEATWREESVGLPAGKKITAVVKFSSGDAANIFNALNNKPSNIADIDAETWFPAELIAQSQLSGDENLKGVAFAADDFFQEPYNQGKITHINETDYFVLELFAK